MSPQTSSPSPDFFPTLCKFLQGTKGDPKYSRRLANFVAHRGAFRVFRIVPVDATTRPTYYREDPATPEGRYDPRVIFLSGTPGNPSIIPLRVTELNTALDQGGSATQRPLPYRSCACSWEEVTLTFWERYMQIGRCLFNWKHLPAYQDFLTADAHYEVLDEQTRRCRYCGDVLHLHRHLRVDVRVTEDWLHTPVDASGAKTFRCKRCHRPHVVADRHQSLLVRDAATGHRGRRIETVGLCPSCFLADIAADPDRRKALLPAGVCPRKFRRVGTSVSSD